MQGDKTTGIERLAAIIAFFILDDDRALRDEAPGIEGTTADHTVTSDGFVIGGGRQLERVAKRFDLGIAVVCLHHINVHSTMVVKVHVLQGFEDVRVQTFNNRLLRRADATAARNIGGQRSQRIAIRGGTGIVTGRPDLGTRFGIALAETYYKIKILVRRKI